jgi:Ca2+-binding RTX toxin-like protein
LSTVTTPTVRPAGRAAIYATAQSAVHANLTTYTTSGGGGRDELGSVENLTGSPFNDILTGNAAANVLAGGNGNDRLWGKAGNDALNGGANFDRGNGGVGSDTQILCEVIAQIP